MKKISIFLISIVIIATSCQKEAEAPVCVLSSTSILGTYKTIAQTSQANAQSPVVDEYATWDACEKDDLNIFSSGGIFTANEGVVSCTPPTDPFTANWTLSGNTLNLSAMGAVIGDYAISNFTCDGFTLSYTDSTTGELIVATLARQ